MNNAKRIVLIGCLFWYSNQLTAIPIITAQAAPQMGDSVASFCIAKILSVKYNIPLYFAPFIHSDLFMFSALEKPLCPEFRSKKFVFVRNEDDVKNNLNNDVVLYAGVRTIINYVSPQELALIKAELQLREMPPLKELPTNIITIGVHIRKGNGGGTVYDGEMSSIQEFDFDQSEIKYLTDYESCPFDYKYYQRHNGYFFKDHENRTSPYKIYPFNWNNCLPFKDKATTGRIKGKPPIDKIDLWVTRFPPNQFYIDQVKKISELLGNVPLYVVICTDDKAPEQLIEKIRKAINKPNVTINYENDRHLPFRERMLRDLYVLSRCDVLIRPQSNFSKTAELIGNHKLVIYPFKHQWFGDKLIMTEIVIQGSIDSLRDKSDSN